MPAAKISQTIANCHRTTDTPFPIEDFCLSEVPIVEGFDAEAAKQEMILNRARQLTFMLGGSEQSG